MRVVAWGTYDLGKPRVRILLRGLRENGVEVIECHRDLWTGIEDKSQLRGIASKLRLVFRLLIGYPTLIFRYLRLARHDAVLVGYMGHLDVLLLWPFAKIRRAPIVWDAFLSLYNTIVEDRRILARKNPFSALVYAVEWLASRAADLVVLDTSAHASYFAQTFRLHPEHVARVFVGAETDVFSPCAGTQRPSGAPFTVLYFGQFIPLHGVDTVIRAAKLCDAEHVHWTLIGKGQEAPAIRQLIDTLKPKNLSWIDWVPYSDLPAHIRASQVCLGIFGTTDKALRVIPNKVFQVLACGVPLITADTPAMRELHADAADVTLVPPGEPEALAAAVLAIRDRHEGPFRHAPQAPLADAISPESVGAELKSIFQGILRSALPACI